MNRHTVLVTGGAGFIGSCYIRMAIKRGDCRIVNLDKLTYAGNLDSLGPALAHPDHIFVRGDIGDRELTERLFRKHQPSAVVNFAAESHVDRSIDSPAEFVKANVEGTVNLLLSTCEYWKSLSEKARNRFRFLQVSTDEVYGSLGASGRFTEASRISPNSPYAASKAAADHFVRAFNQTYGLPTLSTSCSNNYGPFQFPEKLIPLMTLNAVEGKSLPIYGDGENVRDWLFVEDHCEAIRLVLKNGRIGENYNVGGNSERSNTQVVEAICEVLDKRLDPSQRPRSGLIRYVKDRPGHDRRYAVDASKIIDELGWKPNFTFETGLNRTVDWYLENTRWVERVLSGEYQRERLGNI